MSSSDVGIIMWINIHLTCSVRTGQSHRTLLGHTGPITCLQFDEIQIASGSLDKTLKVAWFYEMMNQT